MRFMQRSKDSLAKWLSAILPVVIVGLVGLFAVTVIRDYGRETAAARQTLLKKAVYLFVLLNPARASAWGMRMHHAQQQALLEEMAGQPGVRWFAVTDEQGTIVMHSNSGMVGKQLYSPQEMQQLHPGNEEAWRRIDSADRRACSGNLSPVSTDVCYWNAPDAPYAAVCRDTTSNFYRFRRQ
ncbi:sensor protein ZraS [Escherichia coli]|uniref:Sensor protein ZraS n=1 Tax=Escherichia coli TaxID=562 RepID=A0A376WBQ5_ECOLX|nr:sensor protein ZraS [Escherichia coli]